MFKKPLFFLFSLITIVLNGQVTFIVNKFPETTPNTSGIYISGDFEGWSGGRKELKLNKNKQEYSITIPQYNEHISFKFTKGSWDEVECKENGNPIENRTYSFKSYKDTVYIEIKKWKSKEADSNQLQLSTASENVYVFSENFKIPQLNRTRKIAIYLPPDYYSQIETYPVLYILDGQNIFDITTSYSGEWEVDEQLNALSKNSGFNIIVVAINHGNENRVKEYSAWDNQKHGPGEGEVFLDFIVNTLKPEIDNKYRTKSDKNNTGIMGSSMGGLFSHFAIFKRPDIFGKAAIFSPSFWYSQDCYSFTAEQSSAVKEAKLFYLAGNMEGAGMVDNLEKMISLLLAENYPKDNINQIIVSNGTHNESLWRSQFNKAVLWLFQNN